MAHYTDDLVSIYVGDVLDRLREMPDASVRCCVTSPPYWGLRDYGVDGQIGLESTPEAFVGRLVDVFREVRRVLTDDGTLWVNLGDSYTATTRGGSSIKFEGRDTTAHDFTPRKIDCGALKPKDLCGIPWRVAFALQADGWYLRSDIIWAKPNPMPESVRDRPTKAHEYVFLLSKSARYFWDQDAVREAQSDPKRVGPEKTNLVAHRGRINGEAGGRVVMRTGTRNARTVWTITTKPFSEAHFATFPPELPERCIKAGSAVGDTVLDPFAGAGTTLMVAARLGRKGVGIELNPEYADIAGARIAKDAGSLIGGAV